MIALRSGKHPPFFEECDPRECLRLKMEWNKGPAFSDALKYIAELEAKIEGLKEASNAPKAALPFAEYHDPGHWSWPRK